MSAVTSKQIPIIINLIITQQKETPIHTPAKKAMPAPIKHTNQNHTDPGDLIKQ